MHKPTDNFILDDYPRGTVTQWFGENPVLYRRNVGLAHHNGIDIVAPWGSPLYAIEDGVVVAVKYDPKGYGKHVRIRSHKLYNGAYRCWTYAHLANIHVAGGSEVKEGQQIGTMGNTGFVVSGHTPYWEHNPYAGTHLHLGLRLLEPDESGWRYSHDTVKINVRHYDNGVKGSVDPVQVLKELRPDDRRSRMLTLLSVLNQTVALLKRLKQKTYA